MPSHGAWQCFSTAPGHTRVAEMATTDYAGTGDNARRVTPSDRLEDFFVPPLCVWEDGELLRLDQFDLLDPDLDLENADAALPGFPTKEPAGTGLKIDVTATGQLRLDRDDSFIGELRLQTLRQGRERDWPLEKLIAWLDWKIPHDDIEAHRMGEFLRRTLRLLMASRGKQLPELIVRRYELRDTLTARLRELRKRTRTAAFDDLRLEGSTLTVGPDDLGANLARISYHLTTPYTGSFRFEKHYFPTVGDLKSSGEEFDCAVFIDGLDEVRFWVRNVARLRGAFALPTSTDRFYPDFVCMLKDGRRLAVEYKGANTFTADDAGEKRAIGAVWERRSNGRCLFVMPTGRDYEAIQRTILGGGG